MKIEPKTEITQLINVIFSDHRTLDLDHHLSVPLLPFRLGLQWRLCYVFRTSGSILGHPTLNGHHSVLGHLCFGCCFSGFAKVGIQRIITTCQES